MAYEIEKGVPLPSRGRSGRRPSPLLIALRAMQPGDSVLVPSTDASRGTVSGLAVLVARKQGGEFVTSGVEGGTRVWRIA